MIKNKNLINFVKENKLIKKPIFSLIIISLIAIIIRFHYFSPEVPISEDALNYFIYASDISILNNLPSTWSPLNNGWPIFVSLFFSVINLEETIQYMQVQVLLTIFISVITIVPVYFLCRVFFSNKLSIIGGSLFILSPRIIQNSILGITDALYIFLGISAIVIILKYNTKFIYISFILAGLSTIIRSEGLFLFIIILLGVIIKNRKNKQVLLKIVIGIAIFFLIIFPVSIYKMDTVGSDGMISRLLDSGENYIEKTTIENVENQSMIHKGLYNFPMYFGWSLIPMFICFVPIGIVFLFKKIDYKKIIILLTLIIMSIPAFYAYSIPLKDIRYLYFLYPIFCVISLYPIEKILNKIQRKNILIVLIILSISVTSIIFLEIKVNDEKHEIESYAIANFLVKTEKVINDFQPESKYLDVAEIPKNWPLTESKDYGKNYNKIPIRTINPLNVTVIEIYESDDLEKYILNSEKKLTHIIISENSPKFLKDIFYNENEHPYLLKKFDSNTLKYNLHTKIFEIDYKKFKSFIESNK
jgi:asparagine N-glycosylation enzyme membrane subunit Stt3|tara:strand:+ start:3609 stop:5198 length:1590 start_codon:yes stop_codon:yes gene_type:complete